MESKDENGEAKPLADPDWAPLEDSNLPRLFDVICNDLTGLGALSIDDFLNDATSSSAAFDINFHLQLPEMPLPSPEKDKDKSADAEDSKTLNGKVIRHAIALLRQTCQSVFGSSEPLNYEYLEEDPNSRQCILTITRPNGSTRSYKSDSGPLRRGDAKAQAAQIAVEMGAIDFIVSGDSDALKAKKGLLLNPLDVEIDSMDMDDSTAVAAEATGPPPKYSEEEAALKEIEDCCLEWRAGKVVPHWVSYNDAKNKKKHGAALRMALNAHVFRAYSVNPVHISVKAAKIACANSALQEGVLDFIKYGNGQTEPTKLEDDGLEDMMNITMDTPPPPPTKGLTLQEYYETLPKPFPEDVGDVPASEINAPAWLNVTLQSARGGRLVSSFTPIVDGGRHLHGCILRIERPEETRTYLVDPQFPKRSDAKAGVCLLAMSQGVGDYIRGLKEEAENKLPPEKRKLANEKLLQVLAAECGKVHQGNRLIFNFASERDAFGCTLKVDISPNPTVPDIREYIAKTEYRTKADAKAAVACIAAEQGLIDLLRFRGATPPPEYVPFWEAQINGDGDNYIPKRKELERELDSEGRDRKKRRKGNGENGEVSAPRPFIKIKQQPEEQPLPPKPASLPPIPSSSPTSARWKPHATGSRGLGPTNAYAPAPRSVGQDRSENRSGGLPHLPHGYPAMSASSSVQVYVHPHAYPYDDRMGYRQGPSYQPVPAYPPSDPYGHAYPPYPPPPPPVPGHYASPVYHSPPPQPPPPPAHHYPAHYGAPSPPPPPPSHAPYGHYSYPSQYPPPPQPYPHGSYPVAYSTHPHPPVLYSPPAPPPMPMMPPSPPSMPSYEPYPPRYRSSYPPLSPPPRHPHPPLSPPPRHPHPPQSPPRHSHHSHHASDYISSAESNWQMNSTHRRHNTIDDFSRPRANGYHTRPHDGDRNRYLARPPSPPHAHAQPPDVRQQWHDRPPPNPSRQPAFYPEPPAPEVLTKPESAVVPVPMYSPPTPLEPTVSQSSISQSSSTGKTNLDLLSEFCEKEKLPKPTFYHQVIEEKDGTKKYLVWAEKDAQRFELQHHFDSIAEGHEKLSKRVLQWERSRLAQK